MSDDDSESQIIEFYSFKHENNLIIPFVAYMTYVFLILKLKLYIKDCNNFFNIKVDLFESTIVKFEYSIMKACFIVLLFKHSKLQYRTL